MTNTSTYFAKIQDGIVIDVRVVAWDFLTANPDRYGDSSLWIECFQDGSSRGYCSVGWLYDAINDKFIPPFIEVSE